MLQCQIKMFLAFCYQCFETNDIWRMCEQAFIWYSPFIYLCELCSVEKVSWWVFYQCKRHLQIIQKSGITSIVLPLSKNHGNSLYFLFVKNTYMVICCSAQFDQSGVQPYTSSLRNIRRRVLFIEYGLWCVKMRSHFLIDFFQSMWENLWQVGWIINLLRYNCLLTWHGIYVFKV